MGATGLRDREPQAEKTGSSALAIAPEQVEIRRHRVLLAGVAIVGSVVGVTYLTRASATGAVLDWAVTVLLLGLSAWHAYLAWDARTPLLIADTQGVRVREGRARWRGLPWDAIAHAEHRPARMLVFDGRLTLEPHSAEEDLVVVPLGMATRATHRGAALTTALRSLAGPIRGVAETMPGHQPKVRIAEAIDGLGERLAHRDDAAQADAEPADVAVEEDVKEDLGRAEVDAGVFARWSQWLNQRRAQRLGDEAGEDELETDAGEAVLEAAEPQESVAVTGMDRHHDLDLSSRLVSATKEAALRSTAEPIEPMPKVDDRIEPASHPVIGPELAAARVRLGLSVDQLADRTRIRPHVIEAIEVDDFEPCGGDFYARGHLRTLARILGVDAAPLLAMYTDRYEAAPIDPRRVFAADVTGGSMRGTRGGPNWSVLVAAVMALVLVWSIARLLMDTTQQVEALPGINGSGGISTVGSATAEAVPVLLRAAGGGANVTVRDGTGKIVFTGDIAFGQTRSVKVSPPIKVQSSDGSVEIVVDGTERGRIGKIGESVQNTYVVR